MTYTWQQSDWPEFRYNLSGIEDALFALAERTGHASGLLKGLSADAQTEASIEMMVVEAIKTSAIEGELLSRKDVLSSILKNPGLETGPLAGDKRAQGAAALMIAARNSFTAPLSDDMLFEWHRMIMTGHRHIAAGQWRTHAEPMRVISGAVRHERIHFEAPPSVQVPAEMVGLSNGLTARPPAGPPTFAKPPCVQPSRTSTSSRSTHLKTAMAASVGPYQKRPCRRDLDGPSC
jgi:Fic family protein